MLNFKTGKQEYLQQRHLKGSVIKFLSNPSCKYVKACFSVFNDSSFMFSCCRNAQVMLPNYKHRYLNLDLTRERLVRVPVWIKHCNLCMEKGTEYRNAQLRLCAVHCGRNVNKPRPQKLKGKD